MQIEILHDGENVVSYKFELNQNIGLNLYHETEESKLNKISIRIRTARYQGI